MFRRFVGLFLSILTGLAAGCFQGEGEPVGYALLRVDAAAASKFTKGVDKLEAQLDKTPKLVGLGDARPTVRRDIANFSGNRIGIRPQDVENSEEGIVAVNTLLNERGALVSLWNAGRVGTLEAGEFEKLKRGPGHVAGITATEKGAGVFIAINKKFVHPIHEVESEQTMLVLVHEAIHSTTMDQLQQQRREKVKELRASANRIDELTQLIDDERQALQEAGVPLSEIVQILRAEIEERIREIGKFNKTIAAFHLIIVNEEIRTYGLTLTQWFPNRLAKINEIGATALDEATIRQYQGGDAERVKYIQDVLEPDTRGHKGAYEDEKALLEAAQEAADEWVEQAIGALETADGFTPGGGPIVATVDTPQGPVVVSVDDDTSTHVDEVHDTATAEGILVIVGDSDGDGAAVVLEMNGSQVVSETVLDVSGHGPIISATENDGSVFLLAADGTLLSVVDGVVVVLATAADHPDLLKLRSIDASLGILTGQAADGTTLHFLFDDDELVDIRVITRVDLLGLAAMPVGIDGKVPIESEEIWVAGTPGDNVIVMYNDIYDDPQGQIDAMLADEWIRLGTARLTRSFQPIALEQQLFEGYRIVVYNVDRDVLYDDGLVADDVPFLRGDINRDGNTDATDAMLILRYLFVEPPPLFVTDAADANDDGEVVMEDAIYLLTHLFHGTAAPPAPYPGMGLDPTNDGIRQLSGGLPF